MTIDFLKWHFLAGLPALGLLKICLFSIFFTVYNISFQYEVPCTIIYQDFLIGSVLNFQWGVFVLLSYQNGENAFYKT